MRTVAQMRGRCEAFKKKEPGWLSGLASHHPNTRLHWISESWYLNLNPSKSVCFAIFPLSSIRVRSSISWPRGRENLIPSLSPAFKCFDSVDKSFTERRSCPGPSSHIATDPINVLHVGIGEGLSDLARRSVRSLRIDSEIAVNPRVTRVTLFYTNSAFLVAPIFSAILAISLATFTQESPVLFSAVI